MKKRFLTFKDFRAILAVFLLAVVLVAGLLALNWWIAGQYGTGADLLPAWEGLRAFIFKTADPYSRTVAERTQIEVYGRAARAGEFPYALDIPFPLLLLFSPLAFLPDPIWARAAWMTLSEFGLLLLVTYSLRLADWRPNRGYMFLLLAFSLTWFYSAAALLNGSFSILLVLALVGALIALRDFNDEFAGFLLAITAMKWEVTILLWLFIIIGAYSARRWRVFAGMGMTWVVLVGAAFIYYPDWVWPFLRAITANSRAYDTLRVTPVLFMERWLPEYGARLTQVVIAVLLLILAIEWFSALRGKNFRRVTWVAALSLAIAPLLGFSTTFANLAPLVFSFTIILPFAWERWEKRPYLILLLITLIFFALPILLRWQTIASHLPSDGLTFLLPPVLTILGLYWVRWYVVRPPRTWLDGVKRELHK
jgi:hypothetical protein